MGEWVFRILAAVGIVTVITCLGTALCILISMTGEKRERHEAPKLDARHGYAISRNGAHYIADAPDLEEAREIIRLDEYGMWKTERGIKGPWKLMEEQHD